MKKQVNLIPSLIFSSICFLVLSSIFSLTACNGFFEKDNLPPPAPLVVFTPSVFPATVWSVRAGHGTNGDYLRLNPVVTSTSIVTTSANGIVTSIDKTTGNRLWQINSLASITAGAAVGEGVVVVVSRKGQVVTIREDNGLTLWRVSILGEILAQPSIGHGVVIVKALDGNVHALSLIDGHEVWSYFQTEPSLILRGASRPQLVNQNVIVGFANGHLVNLGLRDGNPIWQQTIAVPEGAFSPQRMIDIDADPVIYGSSVYAATYQGKVASLNQRSGYIHWSRDLSSYTGMVVEDGTLYITDAKSHVWALDSISGNILWHQTRLDSRNITAPASIGNYIVVGDQEGYLHWMNKSTGQFAARTSLGNSLLAAPVVENNILYAYTNNGTLTAICAK